MKKIDAIKLLARPYILELLEGLKSPKRFKDLKRICKNDKTLAKRLKELREFGLVDVVPLKEKGKFVNFYTITKKGKVLLKKIKELKV